MDEQERAALREYGIELDEQGDVIPTAKAIAETEATLPNATLDEKLLDARARTMVAAGVEYDPGGRILVPPAEEIVEGRPLGTGTPNKPKAN